MTSSSVSRSRKRVARSNGNSSSCGIEHVEDDDVGAAVPEVLQPVDDPIRLVEQVGDEHHHAALARWPARDASGFATLVFSPSVRRSSVSSTAAGVRGARWPAASADAVVEGDQADGVALPVHQVRERRRQVRAVLELRHAARAVAHRRADVEQEVAPEVGLFLELLDVVAIGARVDLPVDRRQVVARDVLPVLGELDAEALERAAVQAR